MLTGPRMVSARALVVEKILKESGSAAFAGMRPQKLAKSRLTQRESMKNWAGSIGIRP